MNRMTIAALAMAGMGIGAIGVTAPAAAQEVVQWSAPTVPGNARYSYFPMGTPLRLTTRTELSSKDAHPGDHFYLQVAEPLVAGGQTVLPVGSLAVGEVMRADRNGHWGKRGEVAVRLLYVQTPSGPVRLTGRDERSGKEQRVLAIGGAAFVSWPLLFIHGTSARLPADSALTAYLADDLHFPVVPEAARAVAYADPAPAAMRPLPARFDPTAFGRP